jgi:hypothetical protein
MSKMETGYHITTDPDYLNQRNNISPELSGKLEGFHRLALAGKRSNIKKLLAAIERYPNAPQLKNYLSVLYGQLNEEQKVYDVNRWIIAEHPDYLFGKVNLANEYYLKKEYEKMPLVLGRGMELKALYPERDTFHLIEVVSFLKTAILYFTAIDDLEQAEIRYDIIRDLGYEDDHTDFAYGQILDARVRAAQKLEEEDQKNSIKVKVKSQEVTNISQAPSFAHAEVEWLYSNGLYIGADKLNTILSLPKDSLIQDLELVIQDSIDRYSHFKNWADENEWDEQKTSFVIHAIFILGELRASKSIDAIFDVLSQSEEYLSFYLGDLLTELLWEPLYKIVGNDLEVCKQFVCRPGVYAYARIAVAGMLEQIVWHQPERRGEVIKWQKDLIDILLSARLEDNIVDSEFVALLICDIVNIKGVELLPQINELFERKMVAIFISGDLKEISIDIKEPDIYEKKRKILSIANRYEQITSTWAAYNEEYDDLIREAFRDSYIEPNTIPFKAEPKIGRNDPCPCGSGKKYKKCCLNNN